MINFANSTVGYESWYFISIKFDVEKKWIVLRFHLSFLITAVKLSVTNLSFSNLIQGIVGTTSLLFKGDVEVSKDSQKKRMWDFYKNEGLTKKKGFSIKGGIPDFYLRS